MAPALTHIHRFEPATASGRPPLLLLHGTGGDENDLIDLGRALSPGSALLSPRGNVLEGGAPRFFRRLQEGVFDEADVRLRAHELSDFIAQARAAYGIEAPIAVGFSNGANIAAATLLLRPEALSGAVLLRPMAPLADPTGPAIPGTPVLMLSGIADPIVPVDSATRLAAQLSQAGAHVTHRSLPATHSLTQRDLTQAREFVAGRLAEAA